MKLNIKSEGEKAVIEMGAKDIAAQIDKALLSPEKTLPPALTPEGANPATSGEDAAKKDADAETEGEVMQVSLSKSRPVVAGEKVDYVMPKRGCRFRFARGEYVLGELDSIALVQKWVVENEVDPTKIEVLDASDTWINFDTVKK